MKCSKNNLRLLKCSVEQINSEIPVSHRWETGVADAPVYRAVAASLVIAKEINKQVKQT